MTKRMLSLLLTLLLALAAPVVCPAAEGDFSMPSFFGNHMLFQQNEPVQVWGKAPAGAKVTAELTKQGGAAQSAEATAGDDGNWSLTLPAQAGGYTAYTLTVRCGSQTVTLQDVVFGELWLAAGQSNMEFVLDWAAGGKEAEQNTNDPYLRMLLMPIDPLGTASAHPGRPNDDVTGCRWGKGDVPVDLSAVSALAYYAAMELRQALNVPVGVISAAVGSTPIQTWLSRESIDGNRTLKNTLTAAGLYRSLAQFNSDVQNFQQMTALYNTKIAPLSGLAIKGVFWCQGESNRDGRPNDDGFYGRALEALSQTFSETFGHPKGDLPLLVLHIAAHPYGSDNLSVPKWIEEVAACEALLDNVQSVPLYDVELDYTDPPEGSLAFLLHPHNKAVPGSRLGLAAVHNVYGVGSPYLSPVVKSARQEEGALLVRFDDVGAGLSTLKGNAVHGFTIAGEDGVQLPAKAKIISKNTVKVWNNSLDEPVSFTYAFQSYSNGANLCSRDGLPAMPYRSSSELTDYFATNDWMHCDETEVWVDTGAVGAYQTAWQAAGEGSLTLSTDCYEGTGALSLAHTGVTAAAEARFQFSQLPLKLSRYPYLSLMLKNPDAQPKTIRLLVGVDGKATLTAAPVDETGKPVGETVTLPANAPYTRFTFLVTELAGGAGAAPGADVLNTLRVQVEGAAPGTLLIDDLTVGAQPPRAILAVDEAEWGDVDGNGAINAADALLVLRAAVGKLTPSDAQRFAGDVDLNDAINAADALAILRYAVHRVTAFPV